MIFSLSVSSSHMVAQTARHFKAPMVYVNMVGAQDELIYDGGSFAVDSKGKVLIQAKRFVEDSQLFNLKTLKPIKTPRMTPQKRSQMQLKGLGQYQSGMNGGSYLVLRFSALGGMPRRTSW